MPLVDEETKEIILKKTWCHGQLVLPVFSILYFWLFVTRSHYHHRFILLYASFVLPCWSYLSYRAVFFQFRYYSFRTLMIGFILVELAHAGVLRVMIANDSSKTLHLMLIIASGLFLIETAAFLAVVTAFRPTTQTTDAGGALLYQGEGDYHNRGNNNNGDASISCTGTNNRPHPLYTQQLSSHDS